MHHSIIAENLSPLLTSDQFTMMQQPSASFTSDFIHASLVAANSCSVAAAVASTADAFSSTRGATPRNPRSTSIVVGPKMSETTLATLEYSIHASPRRMTRDLATVFPSKDLSGLLVVPTFQKCKHEMVAWDAEIAKEKDDRLDDFIRWSKALHHRLEKLGYWSDMTDPASGFPSYSERGRDVYPDVEGCQLLLKYDFQNAGCCKVLLHPIWGSKIYPATFFTTAPVDVLVKVIDQVERDHPRPKPFTA
ncbi:hypothetical protein BGX23_006886 [Mortierella sp. AD031]|nr:hypothetical protein BGX23_006886 [Mortierella sp. AD031]KAG0206646.1 hypothetical protein BGX33_007298 [Mortierella sp. NVP41]